MKYLVLFAAPVAFSLLVLALLVTHFHYEFDSFRLLIGHFSLRQAIALGHYHGCANPDNFPPFQHLTAAAMIAAGAKTGLAIVRGWAITSFVSIVALAILAFTTARKLAGRASAWLAMLVIFSGPVIYYGSSSFNEVPAALVTLAFTATVLCRGPVWQTAILFLIAGMTKEVAAPFLLLIWASRWIKQRPRAGEIAAMILATLATFAATAALNELRFGTFYNAENIKPFRIVSSLGQQAKYFAALWCSPSGGLVFFWPMFVVLLLACARALARKDGAIMWIVLLILLGLMTGLSRWHAPFGWDCWGPRLLVPWVPSLTAMMLSAYPRDALRWVPRSRAGIIFAAIILVFFALPHVIAIDHGPEVLREFNPVPVMPEDSARYYPHQNYLMWHETPMLWMALRYATDPVNMLAAILELAAIIGVLTNSATREIPAAKNIPTGS